MPALALLPLLAAIALPPDPVILDHAVSFAVTSDNGDATLTIPLTALVETSPGRKVYQFPATMAFLAPDGQTAIAVIESLRVEYTGDSTIRLAFNVYSGNEPVNFTISTGDLARPDGAGGRALTRARLMYHDISGDGGGVHGLFRPEMLPVELFYSYRAFVNEPQPFSQSFASLLAPVFAPEGIIGGTEGRLPSDGDLAYFFVPVTRFHSTFSFSLSSLDQAHGSSVYYITHTGRCGLADVASIGGEDLPDGQLTPDDLIVYLDTFFRMDSSADLVGPGGVDLTDGEVTPDDLVAFISAFFAGCAQ